jgi:aspartyl aminopeptidase
LRSYFYLRNNSTIIAFRVGANASWSAGGYKILGAHTDSPCLKMKPMSLRSAHGFVQAGVETYAAPNPMPNFTTAMSHKKQTISSL